MGKRCGSARSITQSGIHALMIEAAHSQRSVVRLKSGDPLIFGRAAEELAALAAAGVPVHIVPGVTALFAAGAALQLPLTDRRNASRLILLAGHHAADKPEGGELWPGTLPADSTVAVYMPRSRPRAPGAGFALSRNAGGVALRCYLQSCDTAAASGRIAAARAGRTACRPCTAAGRGGAGRSSSSRFSRI